MFENESRTKILVVDDHPIIRQGLAQLINQEPDLFVCGDSDSAEQALEIIAKLQPDLIIVDISLKGINGLELIKNVKIRFPEILILVLSMHDESLFAGRVLLAGAKGYIMKQEGTEKLIYAIRKIINGGIYVSDRIQAKLLHMLIEGGDVPNISNINRLSDRELEVFQLIGQGHGTRQISEMLHLSIKTIETYRAHIKEKLGIENAIELIQHATNWFQNEAPV